MPERSTEREPTSIKITAYNHNSDGEAKKLNEI